MDHAEEGAAALVQLLRAENFDCERHYDSIRLADSGAVIYFVADDDNAPRGRTASFNVHTYIPRIKRTIHDVAIGIEVDGRSAAEIAADSYLTTVFPIVHILTSDHIDCMGVMSEIIYAKDERTGLPLEYRLNMGPLRNFNVDIKAGDKRKFADAIADLIHPILSQPDVYWFKCFVANRNNEDFDSDCFLNNRNHADGKRRFLDIAKSLFGTGSFQTRKQFLVVVPLELDETIAERDARQRAAWNAAVDEQSLNVDYDLRSEIFEVIEALRAMEGCPNSEIEQRLIERGISPIDACRLPSFIAIACTQYQWKHAGIEWGNRYTLANPATRTGYVRLMTDDPKFRAATQIVEALMKNGVHNEAVAAMLAYSPAHNAISRLRDHGEDLSRLKLTGIHLFTDEPLDGELDHETLTALGWIEKKRSKPWWRFW